MEAIITIISLILGIALLDLSATATGADSRDALPDDHRR
jgi:hypothetical protein